MPFSTFTANKRAKSDIAVTATIVLTVDAKSIELLLSDPFSQIACNLGALNITVHSFFIRNLV